MKSLFIAILTLISTTSTARTRPATCTACRPMEETTRQLNEVDYMNPMARKTARETLVPKALAISERLTNTKPNLPVSAAEMRALVQMIAAETPYDVESNGAAHLAILVRRHKMEALYSEELKKIPEKCRRETLAYYVGSRLCSGTACDKLKDPGNFDDCLLARKSR
jgi:hypothetical protein